MRESNFVKTISNFLYKNSLLVVLSTIYAGVYASKL
jgi:hypothetical protein